MMYYYNIYIYIMYYFAGLCNQIIYPFEERKKKFRGGFAIQTKKDLFLFRGTLKSSK